MSKFLLCEKHQIIFIGGDGCDEKKSEACTNALTLILMKNKGHNAIRGLNYIINDAKRHNLSKGVQVPSNLKECVINAAKSVRPCQEEKGISLVFFVHSLGSRVIYEALQEEIDVERDHMAVFSFGGIQEIPQAFAKIVRNFVIKGDDMASAGKTWHGGKQEEANIQLLADPKTMPESRELVAYKPSAGSASKLFTIESLPESSKFCTWLANISFNREEIPHYLQDYFASGPMFEQVEEDLGINLPIKSGCGCTEPNWIDEKWFNREMKEREMKEREMNTL